MKRINHGLIVGLAVLFLAAVSFVGCESATEAEVITGPAGKDGTGTPGTPGNPGPVYLSGTQNAEGVQAALNSSAPVVFAGATVSGGVVIIPANKTVTLVGSPAISGAFGLIVQGGLSGNGDIGSGTTVVQTTAIPAKYIGSGAISVVAGVPVSGVIPLSAMSGNAVALVGPINIKTGPTVNGDVAPADVNGKDVFVLGGLTVTNTTTPTSLFVSGNAIVTPALDIDTLAIGGTAQFASTLTNTGGAGFYTFNGTTSIATSLTSGNASGLTIAGTGVVTTPTFTGTHGAIISNTGGVILTGASSVATTKTLTVTGKLIVQGSSVLTLTAGSASTIAVTGTGELLVRDTATTPANTLAFSKATIVAPGAAVSPTFTGSTAVALLGFNTPAVKNITLAPGGTIKTSGSGAVDFGAGAGTKLSGTGTFTNTGSVDLDFKTGHANSGIVSLVAASPTTLALTGTSPKIAVPATATTTGLDLTFTTIDLSNAASGGVITVQHLGVLKLDDATAHIKTATGFATVPVTASGWTTQAGGNTPTVGSNTLTGHGSGTTITGADSLGFKITKAGISVLP
ncbi:hypothetical protein AGMMS49942_24800 [Spirochaetia bacterium]|nr:hypothetical protein AGMMS49942_24800 [Spirochaetia bacterium]